MINLSSEKIVHSSIIYLNIWLKIGSNNISLKINYTLFFWNIKLFTNTLLIKINIDYGKAKNKCHI